MSKHTSGTSRRQFVKASLAALSTPILHGCTSSGRKTGASAASTRPSPNNHINIAQIGCGRIGRTMDMPGIMKHPDKARIVAVCDLDSVRLNDARELVESTYAKA